MHNWKVILQFTFFGMPKQRSQWEIIKYCADRTTELLDQQKQINVKSLSQDSDENIVKMDKLADEEMLSTTVQLS